MRTIFRHLANLSRHVGAWPRFLFPPLVFPSFLDLRKVSLGNMRVTRLPQPWESSCHRMRSKMKPGWVHTLFVGLTRRTEGRAERNGDRFPGGT